MRVVGQQRSVRIARVATALVLAGSIAQVAHLLQVDAGHSSHDWLIPLLVASFASTSIASARITVPRVALTSTVGVTMFHILSSTSSPWTLRSESPDALVLGHLAALVVPAISVLLGASLVFAAHRVHAFLGSLLRPLGSARSAVARAVHGDLVAAVGQIVAGFSRFVMTVAPRRGPPLLSA